MPDKFQAKLEAIWAKVDAEFAETAATGDWPTKSCNHPACKRGVCCQRHHHHLGHCCLHCGNDERNLL